MNVVRAFIALGLVVGVGAAQDLRGRVSGACTRADGSPWVGATVVLLTRPLAWGPSNAPVDRVTATTDERGRFHAEILRGWPYAAWAFAPQEDGGWTASTVENPVHPGQPVRLQAEAAAHGPLRIRVVGRDRWQAHEPLRFELVSKLGVGAVPGNGNLFTAQVRAEADGVLVGGPLPGRQCDLVVWSREERPLRVFNLTLPPAGGAPAAEADLGRPARMRVRVEDEDGKPLANATVRQVFEGCSWALGVTGEDGLATVIPVLRQPGSRRIELVGVPPGRAHGRGDGVVPEEEVAAGEGQTDAAPDGFVKCWKGGAVRGVLEWREGQPAAAMSLLLFTSTCTSQGSYSHSGVPLPLRTDEAGRFVAPGIHESCAWRLFVVFTAADLPRLPACEDSPHAPLALLALGNGVRADSDLGRISIAGLNPVDVKVTHGDGAPARCPEVLVTDREMHPGSSIGCVFPWRVPVGRHGRIRILMPATSGLALGAGLGGLFAVDDIVVPSKEVSPLSLVLGAETVLEGVVVDDKGAPLPRALVSVSPIVWGDRSRWRGGQQQLAQAWLRDLSVPADEKGTFRITVAQQMRYNLRGRVDGASWDAGAPQEIEVEVAPVTDIKLSVSVPARGDK